jgi:hypothetical protein
MLFVGALAMGAVTIWAIARAKERRTKRRIYWVGWLSAVGCAAVSLLPLGIKATVIVFVAFSLAVVFQAYISTPYLKLGRRIFAFKMSDSSPDPTSRDMRADQPFSVRGETELRDSSYAGQVSATTLWWVMVVLTVSTAFAVYCGGWIPPTILAGVVLTVLAAVFGIDDATRNLRVARGKYVQAGIITVVSIVLWLAPPVAYLVGYQVGRYKPMGRGRYTDDTN